MLQHLTTPDNITLAYEHLAGTAPGFMFLGGYRSDMTSGKVQAMKHYCAERGIQYTCFDYRGHGASGGAFDEATLGDWIADATHMLETITTGVQTLIGSSMGGHIMLKLALARPERVRGLIGIAAAPDFITFMQAGLSADEREQMQTQGFIARQVGTYDEPFEYRITKKLLEEGTDHLLMDKPITLDCPIILLHGESDDVVSPKRSYALQQHITPANVQVRTFKGSNHRFSKPQDIHSLFIAAEEIRATLTKN